MTDLSKVTQREQLKARREPYWHRLRPGCFLGYRPSKKGGAGTWIARAYDDEAKSYVIKSFGSYGETVARERFALAKQAAETFASEVARGGVRQETIETVEDACRKFAEARTEVARRFARYVYSDPIARVKLAKLRRSHLQAWRDRVASTPARVSRRKQGEQITRPRSPATLNRDMAVLRTALGAVLALGSPNSEAAWQEALKPINNAVKRRTTYLNHEERRRLVNAVDDEAKSFVRALCLLPIRPGATAALTAGDFDKATSELTIVKDKAGIGRRILLPAPAATLLSEAKKDKLPNELLFTRANGKSWTKETWNDPIRQAADQAGLWSSVTAYTLRHSIITDLVASGLPLLTVAQISGTSAEMIERHYGHLVRAAAVEALAGLSL